mmetsp:Transcript_58869/g.133122  ORF Transcript_58869/g.133122 Transcript_58869/m.133122 type:complete len:110 (-) Transcript_58869:546-875(-)
MSRLRQRQLVVPMALLVNAVELQCSVCKVEAPSTRAPFWAVSWEGTVAGLPVRKHRELWPPESLQSTCAYLCLRPCCQGNRISAAALGAEPAASRRRLVVRPPMQRPEG